MCRRNGEAHALVYCKGVRMCTSKSQISSRRFPLGRVVATPGALAALLAAGVEPLSLILRHARGDWGELDDEDRAANERAFAQGSRLLSNYPLQGGVRIWIITEADRS